MASTRTLQQVLNWASLYMSSIPLSGQGGVANEPALTIANSVIGFMLGPPFRWRWNRNSVAITTTLVTGSQTQYNQDYTTVVNDLGWVEAATISNGTTIWPLEVRLHINESTDQGRPEYISAETDDGAGNIKFRLYPTPDQAYTINVTYQKKPVLFTALTGTWAPIPDEYQYLYNSGFLSWAFENTNDSRFPLEYQKFIRAVIAAEDGLSESQKAIFLEERLLEMRQQQGAMIGVQQGRAARGMQ